MKLSVALAAAGYALAVHEPRFWHYPESPGRRPKGSYRRSKRTLSRRASLPRHRGR
jgi:hypothetical protein